MAAARVHRISRKPALRPRLAQGRPRALLTTLVATLLAAALLAACDADLQKFLDDLSGKPKADSSSGTVDQAPLPIPTGPHLYCITNIGHTLVLYDLNTNAAETNLQRYLDLDPVGPWFYSTRGYYISRVDTSGHGANALIEFDPKTTLETRRIGFGVNTNPNSMLVLPGFGGVAWVAVRGSTNNAPYGPDGIGVVNLNTMTGTLLCFAASSICPNALSGFPGGAGLHSLISFVWDAACPVSINGGQPCVYAIVNGFDGVIHSGTLLVLAPDISGTPTWLASVPLGLNPLEDMFLDAANQRLWVVNNGGYTTGSTGTLQAIDTTTFSTVSPSPVAAGFAPTGIFGFDASTAWVTTYPSDVVETVGLAPPFTFPSTPIPGNPSFTGSVVHTTTPGAQIYAGAGGFGAATLAQLDTTDGHLIASHPLHAGSGTVSCGQFTTP